MIDWKKNILFVVLLVMIFLPLIQQKSQFVTIEKLTGSKSPRAYPDLTWDSWKEGKYQQEFEQSLEEQIGFRPSLVRFKNQIQFSLFRKANATGVIVGKKGYLFEKDYIRAYTGKDFLGEWFWTEKFHRAQMVHDTLKSLGIELALILEPGKASYYPEYIPDRFLQSDKVKTNYDELIHQVGNTDIPFLDLNEFFVSRKNETEFPHFPKGGIHWAYASMLESVDTLLRFADQLSEHTIPDLEIIDGEVTHELRDTDNDLVEIMNLMVDPGHPDMHYPEFSFEQIDDSLKPKVLAISDSFYFNILNAGIPAKAFFNEAFWYYSKSIYPETWIAPKDTSMINFQKEVEKMDIILMMITERFYYKFAWNFIETLYRIYYPDVTKKYYYDYHAKIITDYNWFDLVIADAQNRGVSMSEALMGHAKYQFWQDEQKGIIPKDVGYYMIKINQDPAWLEKIKEKAIKNGKTVEQQVELDAQWMSQNN